VDSPHLTPQVEEAPEVPETPAIPEPVKEETPEEPKAAKPDRDSLVKDLQEGKEKAAKPDPAKAKPERVFKVKLGEALTDLKPEATMTVKVDGKEETVKIQDLVDNYSGKTNWSRKYQQLSEEKKTLQETVNQLYDNFVAKGDAMTGIEVLVEALGGNPLEVRQKVTDTLLKQIDSYANLSPEEREAAKLRDELSYRRKKEETEKVKTQHQAEIQQLQGRLEAVMKTHGLTEEQLAQTYEELKSLNVPLEQLTPELLGDYHKQKQEQVKTKELDDGISAMLKDIEAEFESDEAKSEATQRLKKVMQVHPEMTLTELKDAALEVYGSKAAKNLARKLKKAQPTPTNKAPDRVREPITFSDL